MYIDFHTHILPHIDDGAKDTEMALAMLGKADECGAELIVLTPHVSYDANIETFITTRNEEIRMLKDAARESGVNFPKILAGAEVALSGALSERDNVRELCIEGTELILLELPYTSWSPWYNNEIYNLISRHNVTPVMAHIERYIKKPQDIEKLSTLVSLGVQFQINARSFLTFSGKKIIRELAAEGMISAIGSDCHDTGKRSPDISQALNTMEKKFAEGFLEYIYHKNKSLLEKYKL